MPVSLARVKQTASSSPPARSHRVHLCNPDPTFQLTLPKRCFGCSKSQLCLSSMKSFTSRLLISRTMLTCVELNQNGLWFLLFTSTTSDALCCPLVQGCLVLWQPCSSCKHFGRGEHQRSTSFKPALKESLQELKDYSV